MKTIIIAVASISIVSILAFNITSSSTTETIKNVKIKKLKEQQLINGTKGNMSTEMRYLVITDKGTFICESNWLQGKFNNSDIFYNLVQDSTYSEITVSGFGKRFFNDYQNLISVK